MRDEDELHSCRHFFNDIAETPDVVLIQRGVDLIQKTEWCRIELENRENQRHGGQRLLTARQQVDGAVFLARGTCHDGNAGRENIFADQLQVRMTAAEQLRKLLLEAGIDSLERFLEASPGFLVDPAHRLIEGLERRGQVGKLTV